MAYRFATERVDYQDLASGFVVRSAPGFPGFPVRLASELFQRARARQRDVESGELGPAVLWDPMCGGGYLATVLGLLHGGELARVFATDVDVSAVGLAGRNLALLSADGLLRRRAELADLAARYGKAVHQRAGEAVDRLIQRHTVDLPYRTSVADVFRPPGGTPLPDLVIGDVPYGEQTHWHGVPDGSIPVTAALRGIATVVAPHALIALTARTRKIDTAGVPVLERFRIGRRAAVLVRATDLRQPF